MVPWCPDQAQLGTVDTRGSDQIHGQSTHPGHDGDVGVEVAQGVQQLPHTLPRQHQQPVVGRAQQHTPLQQHCGAGT